jgi:DNA polymerase-4
VLRHPELDALAIAHVDCDAFYATIEKRDDPTLADKPVIVGGRQRGVVLTACYVARTFGVRSAMPMFEARRLCPHASVVRPDMEKYARVGREVRALMFKLTPLVEPVSIDEAFMDLSGTARLHGMSPARRSPPAADVENSLDHGVDRPLLQQVPCQDRLRSDSRAAAVLGAGEWPRSWRRSR